MSEQLISILIIIFVPLFVMEILFSFFDFIILKNFYDKNGKDD